MNQEKSKTRQRLILLIPFIVMILVMLPRLTSPQFGFFDDARMLSQSQHFLEGDFSMSHDIQAGRFRPIYWLYYTLIYALAGYHPFWYFLGNLILFFILLYELRVLLKRMAFANWQILLTSLVFLFSMPIIENFYTLGKGEPLQLIFLLSSLILLNRIKAEKRTLPRLMLAMLSAVCILLAILVKETAMVIFPIAMLWLIYLLFSRDAALRQERSAYLFFTGSTILAVITYFFIRSAWGATSILGGTYTNRYLVDLSALFEKLLRWMTQFAFYFHYLIPLAGVILFLAIFKFLPKGKILFGLYRWGIWTLLWFAVLIPWEYAELYYLLPFALGGAILIGWVAQPFWRAIQALPKGKRWVLNLLGGLTGLLFILTLPNYRTDAKTQLTFDQVNQNMLHYVVEQFPADSTIYMNLQTTNEYSEKFEVYLREHYQMDSIQYGIVNEAALANLTGQKDAVILMPTIENQPRLTVRAGVEERYQTHWNAYMLEVTAEQRETLQTFSQSFRLSNVNLPALICPLLRNQGFCESPDPLIDTRLFSYGWEIYQIK